MGWVKLCEDPGFRRANREPPKPVGFKRRTLWPPLAYGCCTFCVLERFAFDRAQHVSFAKDRRAFSFSSDLHHVTQSRISHAIAVVHM